MAFLHIPLIIVFCKAKPCWKRLSIFTALLLLNWSTLPGTPPVITSYSIHYTKLYEINAIYGDALEVEVIGKYDLIFIDAAKAQSIKFFQKYEKNLNDNGTIITDNINFHGLTFTDDKIDSRNVRQLIRKIKTYLEWLDSYNFV